MSRRDISVETVEPSRDEDLTALSELAAEIETLQDRLVTLMDIRRVRWDRRLRAGDTTKAQLARASHCHAMNVSQGLKPELMAKTLERMRGE